MQGAQHISLTTVAFSRMSTSKSQLRTFLKYCRRQKYQPTQGGQWKGWRNKYVRKKDSSWILMSVLYEWDQGNSKTLQPNRTIIPRGHLYPKLKFFYLYPLQAVWLVLPCCPFYQRACLISEMLNTKKQLYPHVNNINAFLARNIQNPKLLQNATTEFTHIF